jgi:hypothetical protein
MARKLDIKTYDTDPRSLRLLSKHDNARYMTAAEFQRLVANVKRDGVLTSSPLVYRDRLDDPECRPVVLSGNHRTEASIEAGLATITVMEIITRLTPEEQRAIQLSHNAIAGQDDLSRLFELYDALPFTEKQYSGLTDDSFEGLPKLNLEALSIGAVRYQEVALMFLPSDVEGFEEGLKRIQDLAKRMPVFVGRVEDFDRLFDAIVAVKQAKNVFNTALAFNAMAQLALEALEAEGDGAEGDRGDGEGRPADRDHGGPGADG